MKNILRLKTFLLYDLDYLTFVLKLKVCLGKSTVNFALLPVTPMLIT